MAFKDDIKLSIYELDKSLIELPSLYDDWSTKWADAVHRKDDLENQIENHKTNLDEKIRENPQKFGWESQKDPTEVFIKSAISRDPGLRKLNLELIEAQYDVNKFGGAKATIEKSLKAIDILTELYKGNYWAGQSKTSWEYREKLTEKHAEEQRSMLKGSPRLNRS